ncbi:MAG TPA: 2-hydroxyacid dehydrogenase [Alphaproteobacteria bacterium]|nr:2-hydroxyacid dehydrogenase [Alphaproteobacteria bacterium]
MLSEILMMGPMPPIERALEADFRIHKLWEHPDRASFFAEIGPRIRGIVSYSGAAPVDAAVLAGLPNVGIVTNMGVGYESVDAAIARERGIVVTNAAGVNAVDVGENAFAMILAFGRGIVAGDRYVRAGRWAKEGRRKMTRRVSGRTIGILGLGNIGMEIAKRAVAFDMPVFYHNRHKRTDVPYTYCETLPDLAKAVDFLVVATPGGVETEHLVNEEVLAALGPDGALINIARGTVVDEKAMIAMLSDGRLGGAGLDVFEDEPNVPEALFALENVVLQPHQGGATHEGVAGAVALVGYNMRAFFNGDPIKSRVV